MNDSECLIDPPLCHNFLEAEGGSAAGRNGLDGGGGKFYGLPFGLPFLPSLNPLDPVCFPFERPFGFGMTNVKGELIRKCPLSSAL